MSEIVDSRALAARYRVTAETVLAWARRGWIPCLRAGQRPVLFDAAAVRRALARRGTNRGLSTAGRNAGRDPATAKN